MDYGHVHRRGLSRFVEEQMKIRREATKNTSILELALVGVIAKCNDMIEFGSCPRTARRCSTQEAVVTGQASARRRAPVRGHPLCFTFHAYATTTAKMTYIGAALAAAFTTVV